MNSSTPLRASSDASPSPLQSPVCQQDEATPSTSRGRGIGSVIGRDSESTFHYLALDVSYAGLGVTDSDFVDSGSKGTILNPSLQEDASDLPQFWEDIGVVEYLERRLGPPDESTPEERVATLREVLAERTDIHEGDGNLSDFLFHVARTKHGKIYIRVIRTLLMNRDTSVTKLDDVNGMILVETFNIIPVIVDDPYVMGKIAYAVALGGIYSLGLAKCSSTRMILGLSDDMKDNEKNTVMIRTLQGYVDAAKAADMSVKDCRIFRNPWCLFGGTTTVVCYPSEMVQPVDATVGDVIVLTKPLGTTVALTISEWMQQPEKKNRLVLTITEESVERARSRAIDCMTRTNRVAATLMRMYNAHAACEVGPYGILGHANLLARRQTSDVSFVIHNMPMIARMCATAKITGSTLPLLQGEAPEISGGLLVVLPREQAVAYCKALKMIEHRQAWIVGIVENGDRTARLIEKPRVIEVPVKDNGVSLW